MRRGRCARSSLRLIASRCRAGAAAGCISGAYLPLGAMSPVSIKGILSSTGVTEA